jgi:hypothetical protein
VVGATIDNEGILYARKPVRSLSAFYHEAVTEPKHGYENWPEVKPRVPPRGKVPNNIRLISTELGIFDDEEVMILDQYYETTWQALTGETTKYEDEDYDISRFVGGMLRHANCYRRLPMNAMGYSPYNDVLSITAGSLANKARIQKKRVGVSRCNFPGFLRGPNHWIPWMIRVSEGHTISMINDLPLAHIITRDDMERMPALCHGTSQDAIPSIL